MGIRERAIEKIMESRQKSNQQKKDQLDSSWFLIISRSRKAKLPKSQI